MYATDLIAEFYASSIASKNSMTKITYTTTTKLGDTDALQSLIVGCPYEVMRTIFCRDTILTAYMALGKLLAELHQDFGCFCSLIGDHHEHAIDFGLYILEVVDVNDTTCVVAVGEVA